MLLRNYDNIMTVRQLCSHNINLGDSSSAYGDGNLCVKNSSGTLRQLSSTFITSCQGTYWGFNPFVHFYENANSFADLPGTSNTRIGECTLVCGSDNTPVMYDDYKLGSQFTNTQVSRIVKNNYESPIYNSNTNTWSSTYSTTVLANEPIIIKEIGIYTSVQYDCSSTKYLDKGILIYRKVLDTPIEVPAGTNFVLSFTTTVSANPNKPADYDATVSVE